MSVAKTHTIPFLTPEEVEHCQIIKTIGTPLDIVSLNIIDRLTRLLDAITELDDPVREIEEAEDIIRTYVKPKEGRDDN